MGAAWGTAHVSGESRGACGHPAAALGLPALAGAAATEPRAGKGLLVTCQGAWVGLGTAETACQEKLVQTNRKASEMGGERACLMRFIS